jgi:energy-coupling factor transporter ATP-binding protein EcfA2
MSTPIRIDQSVPPSGTYRSERVRSMFNATDEQATRFTFDMDLPIDLDGDWSVGVIVGPSGTGKSSIGRSLWDGAAWYESDNWPHGVAVVDAIGPNGSFDDVTGALSSAGLGDVPVWLRPYEVLSTGQKFRADLARVLAEHPDRVVFDEFTSVVDRQIAKVGAGAFAKAWRRTGNKVVLLSCHYDILDWVEPDWVLDTGTKAFQLSSDRDAEGKSWRRPKIDVEIRLGGWDLWDFFKPHHYLDLPPMVGGKCYVAFVDGEPVAHLGVATKNVATKDSSGRLLQTVEARASRLVVLPEWQGAGVGIRFLNEVCRMQLEGNGVLPGRRMTTQFQTSHPQLCQALRRSPLWRQVSGTLAGSNKSASKASLSRSAAAVNSKLPGRGMAGSGFGGHLRAVQGFRFYGPTP